MYGCHVQPEQIFNLIFGYHDRWKENLSHTKVGNGDYAMNFGPVPDNEVWVLQASAGRSQNRGLGIEMVSFAADTDFIPMNYEITSGAWVWSIWTGGHVLKYQDFVRITFYACINNDVVVGNVWGYKMRITQ